ncbi:MAG: hypothetical protein ACSLEY_03765 [Candidatus Saccharimonadales bacterium]
MATLNNLVNEIVPPMFEAIVQDRQYPTGYNMAGSNQCHVLTKGLLIALESCGELARREFHTIDEGKIWHYVIAHMPIDVEPTDKDIITDLNPWQFMRDTRAGGTFLHGSRLEVMDRLYQAGAPDYFIALRGLSTIAQAHKVELQ